MLKLLLFLNGTMTVIPIENDGKKRFALRNIVTI